jgi:hypothetical protein
VRNDFVGVRDAVVTTGTTGETAPAAVKLGTRFPGRTLFVNPPPAVGRIETGEPRNVTLNVSQAAFSTDVPGERAETEEGWPTAAATDGNYTSRPLVYTPQYRSYDGGPENITLELSHAVATYPDGERLNLTQTPLLVSGDRVTLFLLKGNLSETGVESVTLEPSAVSAVSDRQRVSNFNVTVPTSLTANQFETVLTRGNTLDRGDVIVTENTSRRAVDVRFPDEYALGVAAVSVGRHQEQRRASAVDFVSVEENVTQGESARVVVGVRDQYGNALPGATVTANASAFDGAVQQTDGTGRTAFEFNTSGESGTVAVNVTVNENIVSTTGTGPFDQSTAENATANVTVEKPSDGGGGGNGTSGSWPFWWVSPDAIGQNSTLTLTDCDNESCTVDAGDTDANLNLRVTTVGETSGANVTYAINDTSVASLNESTSTTNAAGNDTVALRPEANGSFGVRVSATSGGTTATIRVRYQNVNYTPGTAPPSPAVKITAVQPDPDKLPDSDGEFVRIEIPTGVDTSGWTLKGADGSQSLSDRDGTVYFARDVSAFVDQWNLGPETVVSLTPQLNNGGETVNLLDADGNEIDRFAYGGGSETFSDGNSFTFSDSNAVANRTNLAADGTYDDTDSPSDWSEEDACQFFDGGDGCPAALNTKKVRTTVRLVSNSLESRSIRPIRLQRGFRRMATQNSRLMEPRSTTVR